MKTGRIPAVFVASLALVASGSTIAAPRHAGAGSQAGASQASAARTARVSLAAAPGGEVQRQDGADQSAQEATKDIEACRKVLATTGPNARREREKTVTRLFSMDDPRAHEVLQEYIVPGPDPDGLRRMILARLPGRLANENEAAFHSSKNSGLIRRSYVMKLVRHFDGKPPESPQLGELRRLARDGILAMRIDELQVAFGQLLSSENIELRKQAIRTAGQTRDPVMAKMLAPLLEDPDPGVQAVVEAALYDLTYQKFVDQKMFDAWFAKHHDREYLELAEEAARMARRIIDDEVGAAHKAHVETIQRLVEVLATSTRKDKWNDIRATVFAGAPPGVMQRCLVQLCAVLATVPVDAQAGDSKDRLQFFDEISRRLQAGTNVAEFALLLEVASYLCAPGEAEPRKAQEARLREAVTHSAPVVRLAALRGLRRFFSPANRKTVIVATAQAFQARDLQQLEVAMATLMSPGWLAPQPGDGDLSAWVGTLREVFLTADLPTRVRIDVVKVLSLADAAGNRLPQVFQLLREEVARPTLAAEVRSAVLFGLQELIPSAGEAREIAAEQYLDLLEGLQTDKDVKLRLDAARLLDVPDNLSAKKSVALGQRLVEVVGERLLVETDDQVFSAQVMALRNLTAKDQDAHVGAVNSRLRTALDVLRARPATDRLGTLISGLETVALNERRTAAEWFETCRRLLDVPQVGRKSIRGILEFHIGRNPARLQSESKELQAEVHKLVIRTAVLRPDSDPWRSDKTGAEARMVQRAFKSLLASGEFEKGKAGKKDAIDSPRTRLTCLRALASLATPADAAVLEQQVSKWLEAGDQVLQGPDRDAARLLYAESLLQQGRPEDAWQKSGLQAVNGPNLDERLRVTDELAAAMIKRRPDEAAALPLLADVVQKTPPTSEAYWPRFCRWLELRHTVDPKTGAALLKELDAWIATRGKLNGTVKDQADRLRAALAGDAVPGK